MKLRLLFPVAYLTVVCNYAGAIDPPGIHDITVSGLNELRIANGYDISYDFSRPWKYLTNSTDVRVGIGGLYLKTRFDVEEPSRGYNPLEPVYREYFSRRTVGFEVNPIFIEAGHVSTQFGRGLTLSLKEDREIELYTLIDGVYGQLRFPLVTVQGIAGRPVDRRNRPVALLDVSGWEEPDTILVIDQADLRFRDLVAGLYTEAYFPVDNGAFAFLSSGSIGGGLVRYLAEVGPLAPAYHDTANLERPFWYQNRTALFLPSVAMNMSRGDFGLSMEHAWMKGAIHQYVNLSDSVRGAFDSVYTTPTGFSSYISLNAQLFGVSLLAEHKNYYFDRSEAFSKEVSALLIPPSVRYQHSWHLLNKHMFSNFMANALGYKFMLNWSPIGSTLFTADFSFGGLHDRDSHVRIKTESGYWEAYGEWAQEAGDRVNFKVGIDYGKMDPEQQKVTYRTLAFDVDAGPFGGRHSFGFILENQLNDKPFLAEKSRAALIDLITRMIPADSLRPFIIQSTGDTVARDTLLYDYLVPDKARSRYRQFAFNVLATVSYHLAPWLSLSITLERETLLEDQDYIHVVTDLSSKSSNYASIGMNLKPTPRHTITVEYGSMSGGKKCTLGTCVDLPPFKGFKLTVNSML